MTDLLYLVLILGILFPFIYLGGKLVNEGEFYSLKELALAATGIWGSVIALTFGMPWLIQYGIPWLIEALR